MKFDFSQLDPAQFERLCAALLTAAGYRIKEFSRPGAPDHGIDFFFESNDGVRWIAQVKVVRSGRMPMSVLRSAVLDLHNGVITMKAQMALLMVSIPVSTQMRDELPPAPNVQIWDADMIESLLDRHHDVQNAYTAYIASKDTLDSFIKSDSPQAENVAADLIAELTSTPPGTKSWKQYEDVCVKILNYAFIPPLRIPKVQSRTHDGLDRRDAIYPIGSGHAFWDSIKHQHSARMVVVEFKNYKDPIGQKEVESLQQYLMPQAKRSFGIICSRKQPAKSAQKARRRAWMTSNNLILFLSDLDLQDLVRARADNEDTSRILESQMDDFFITLAP
jgi:hypothetical protein